MIIHRDIKSSNILLDENLEPRVSDFGLAKLVVDEDAHVTTVVAGTFGYLAPGMYAYFHTSLHYVCISTELLWAPEYLQSGRATEKTDVYSFGVLLLELVTGKRPTDPTFVKHGLNVVGWVCYAKTLLSLFLYLFHSIYYTYCSCSNVYIQMNTLLKENRVEDVVDRRCRDADVETVEAVLEIAARCTDSNPDDRPTMQQVLQFLEQEVMSPCPSDFYESHSDYS